MSKVNEEQIRESLLNDEGVRSAISVRAYEIYESRGCMQGCDLDDWLQAEDEVLAVLIEQPSGEALELSEIAETEETANQVESQTSEAAPKRKGRG